MVAYVRTSEGYEVDFLAFAPGGSSLIIQVCAEIDDPDTFRREVRALEAAARLHPEAEALLLTLDLHPTAA